MSGLQAGSAPRFPASTEHVDALNKRSDSAPTERNVTPQSRSFDQVGQARWGQRAEETSSGRLFLLFRFEKQLSIKCCLQGRRQQDISIKKTMDDQPLEHFSTLTKVMATQAEAAHNLN
ncbi:hypothetical protein [uncultured Roseibium sp.]|uniref:hypothetical protein n=1 Tax=uncultured Roseibium sp. TaxID=1936171 RepID=UPI00262ADE9E|nr:hypothetical protein [uncultured Roseibium sp.]